MADAVCTCCGSLAGLITGEADVGVLDIEYRSPKLLEAVLVDAVAMVLVGALKFGAAPAVVGAIGSELCE